MRQLTAVLLAICALGCFGCDLLGDDDDLFRSLPFETLDVADSIRIDQAGMQVIREPAEWQAFWQANRRGTTTTPAPAVDLQNTMVVALSWGPDGGAIDPGGLTIPGTCSDPVEWVRSVFRSQDRILIDLVPKKTYEYCEAILYPFQVIVIPDSPLPVVPLGNLPQERPRPFPPNGP